MPRDKWARDMPGGDAHAPCDRLCFASGGKTKAIFKHRHKIGCWHRASGQSQACAQNRECSARAVRSLGSLVRTTVSGTSAAWAATMASTAETFPARPVAVRSAAADLANGASTDTTWHILSRRFAA